MTEHVLALTTTASPTKTFTVDDTPYDLLGVDHLSKDDEALVTALFARSVQLGSRLVQVTKEEQQIRIARELRKTRVRLLAKLTTMPEDVADLLPPQATSALMELIEVELGIRKDDDFDLLIRNDEDDEV